MRVRGAVAFVFNPLEIGATFHTRKCMRVRGAVAFVFNPLEIGATFHTRSSIMSTKETPIFFNPLEIGATFHTSIVLEGEGFGNLIFQSPRNRGNISHARCSAAAPGDAGPFFNPLEIGATFHTRGFP